MFVLVIIPYKHRENGIIRIIDIGKVVLLVLYQELSLRKMQFFIFIKIFSLALIVSSVKHTESLGAYKISCFNLRGVC